MRSEIRKRYLMVCMAMLLAVAVVVAQVRLFRIPSQISPEKNSQIVLRLTGSYGRITTRDGVDLYNGNTCCAPVLSNLVGMAPTGTHQIHNAIAYRYRSDLAPKSINAFSGYHGLVGLEGKVLTTTLLSDKSQDLLAARFEDGEGCVFAYNYKTGEVYTALSLDKDSYLINKVLKGTYIPGSTMKIATLACALEQNPDLQNFVHTCTGKLALPGGGTVRCHGIHGEIGMTKAIGKSCNCYFAALVCQLDPEKACGTLRDLGFLVNGEEGTAPPVDRLNRTASTTVFQSNSKLTDVWGMVGQGQTAVNLMDMAQIAGAVANGGQAARPYLVRSIYDPNEKAYSHKAQTVTNTLLSEETAALMHRLWKKAVEQHYETKGLDDAITLAKTGTAQIGADKQVENRLLLGVIEESDTAFIIVVEDASDAGIMVSVANTLVEILAASSE